MTATGHRRRRKAAAEPPAIQPHGLLFALDPATLEVIGISANAGAILGRAPAKVLGTGAAEHLGESYAAALAAFARGRARSLGPTARISLRRQAGEPAEWRAVSYRNGDCLVVEIGPVSPESPEIHEFLLDAVAVLRSTGENTGVAATAGLVVRRLREMTGYDRVVMLRFDAENRAEPVAESKASWVRTPLEGFRLEAEDMPAAARRLALRNPVRMVRDAGALPVPILMAPAARHALDLDDALLRAPAPGLAQLLARLGARAALILSLVRDKRLWGLVAFVHRTPRRLSLPHRATLQLMADAITMRLAAAEALEHEREIARRRRVLDSLRRVLDREAGDAPAILRRHGKALLRAVDAGGGWCQLPDGEFALGHAPAPDAARRVLSLCRMRGAGSLYATDQAAKLDHGRSPPPEAAGVLYLPLPRSRGAILLTRERSRGQRSAPWTAVDLAIAAEAAATVDDVAPRLAERRNLRRALENEAKLRAILDATQDGLIAIDRAGTILDFSSGAERLLGWSAAEIVGQSVELLIPETFRPRHNAALAQATHDLRPRVMGRDARLHALRKDGSTFPFEITLTSLVLGGETFFIGALRDLSERLNSEERDRFWFQHSSVGYSVSDAAGRRLRVNPALCRILGYSEPELLARGVLETLHPEDVPAAAAWREQVRAGGDDPFHGVQRMIRKDGAIVWGRVTASALRPLGSRLIQIVSEVVDITDLMEAEVKLRRALARAEAASTAKSQFLATMSHELRTPLNAIIGLSEMMAGEVLGPLGNRRYLEYGRDINRAGRHLLDLVTDVLDTSRIEAGVYRLSLALLDLGDVIDETHRLVAPIAAERGVRLGRRLPPDLPAIRADRRALKQVLINVVSNAIKFTPEQGEVTIAADTLAGDVAITVSDTGRGIAPEHLSHVIEPFYRAGADAYTTPSSGGVGLGLAIANGLVAAHGGSLAIASEVGKGTTVTLRFPPAPPAA
jgi:PAS domain S-box-containing protein